MKKSLIIGTLMCGLLSTPAWALFESNKELLASAKIPLDQAIEAALHTLPGKAVMAEIDKNGSRTVYEVEIVDGQGNIKEVYIDANTGNTLEIDH